MYVCICKDINDKQIIKAIEAGNNSFKKLQESLEVATCCGRCEPMVNDILFEETQNMCDKLMID